MQSRSYNKDDEKRYVTEVVADQVEFLEWGSKKDTTSQPSSEENYEIDMNDFEAMDDDEDIPF